MTTIQDHLKTHLFTCHTEKLLGCNTPLPQLFNGITYEYNGKVWNVRIAWDKRDSEDIHGLFIRVHNEETFYGEYFSKSLSKLHHIEWKSITFSKNSSANDIGEPTPQTEQLFSYCFDSLPQRFTRLENTNPPKITQACQDYVKDFFKEVPYMIPQVRNPFPQPQPPRSQQEEPPLPREEASPLLKYSIIALLSVLGIFTVVKVSQRLLKNPLNSKGTGAVA